MAIREYLKHSQAFRTVFFVPIKLRAYVLGKKRRLLNVQYDDVVRGGRIRVKPRNLNGEFWVSATSHLARRSICDGIYEPELTELISRIVLNSKSGAFVNVGANVGFYAVHLARMLPPSARVVAIEPNPEAFELLTANVQANAVGVQVECIQRCVSDTPQEVKFSFIPGKSEYSSINGIVHEAVDGIAGQSIRVQASPLDELVSKLPVRFILIDTEGAELLVLRSASRILRQDRPVILLECSDVMLKKFGHGSEAVESLLVEQGYIVRNALAPSLSLQHPFEGEALAVPVERKELLAQLY